MNTLKNIFLKLRFALLAGILVTVYGCGGGGGSTTPAAGTFSLSGTAAAGAPIIGTVTVKDSSTPFKTKTVTIAADGKYTIDVSGMTAPFMLNATGTVGGTTYNLYSAAVSTDINGNINVTPLTDLIVANVAGQIASTYFSAGNFSALTAVELTAQETALQARLQDVLNAVPGGGVAASIDLLRSSFATDHTGLDAALDVLRVDIVGGTATITNIISNQQATDDIASKTDAEVAVGATGVATGITDLQAIAAGFNAFSARFATSLPASDDAALNALFDTNFLLEGQNTTEFLSEITSNPTLIGVKFTNISLVPGSMTPVDVPTTAKVIFTVIQGGGNGFPIEFTMNKVGGVWKMAGDGRIAQANALSFTRLQDVFINNVQQINYIDTGLVFEIKAPTATGLSSIGATVPIGASYYAIVTGAGLPSTGALYVSDFSQAGNGFRATSASPLGYAGNLTPSINAFGFNQYPLLDDVIATLADNEVYTIKICHDNATVTLVNGATVTPAVGAAACQLGANTVATSDDVLLATYTSNAGKRPYLRTELSVASFAAITAPSKTALTTFANAGGTITVSWTLPAATLGAKPESLHYFRGGSTGSDNTNVDLGSTATSASLAMLSLSAVNAGSSPIGVLCANGINLRITDNFSRELTTIYNGDQGQQGQGCFTTP